MRLRPDPSTLCLSLAFPILSAAATFDCGNIVVDGHSYDFSALKGRHYAHYVRRTPPTISNTTFTIDVCEGMTVNKGKDKKDQCPNSTRVCATTQVYPEDKSYDPNATPETVITIAGDFQLDAHRPLDPSWEVLQNSPSNSDSEKEGLRLEMKGGLYPLPKDPTSMAQKAIIEFICDAKFTGTEGQVGNGKAVAAMRNFRRADDDNDELEPLPDPDKDHALTFIKYHEVSTGTGSKEITTGVLRMEWRTKFACEEQSNEGGGSPGSSHWGFFTWLIIIIFMGTASYLIFGSWLNYNRHGARGWDLVPHGDSIRDVPYMVKDWTRRAMDTVQGGGGSRDLGYIRV